MHSAKIDHNDGDNFHQEFIIHHNGDYSGDVSIVIPVSFKIHPLDGDHLRVERITSGGLFEDYFEVRLPFEVLAELVGRYMSGELTSSLEDLSGLDVVRLMSAGIKW